MSVTEAGRGLGDWEWEVGVGLGVGGMHVCIKAVKSVQAKVHSHHNDCFVEIIVTYIATQSCKRG